MARNAAKNDMHLKFLLLPGLDGTGKLFRGFTNAAPNHIHCQIIAYEKHLATLDDFVAAVAPRLSTETKTVIIAESFSGPIATQLALRFPERIAAIVFAASFVEPPHGWLLSLLVRLIRASPNIAFGNPTLRRWFVKYFCLNGVQDKSLIDEVVAVVGSMDSDVIRRRIMLLSCVEFITPNAMPVVDFQAVRDRVLSRAAMASVMQAFPNAITVKFDAPHFLLLTQPEQCWIEIEKYLANISSLRCLPSHYRGRVHF